MDLMKKVVLQATRRPVTGKKVGALRRAGQLPAVLYGHNFETTPILLDLHEATVTLARTSGSQLVTINLDGKELATLVREKQRNYVKNLLLHIDFQVVSLTEKIRANVPVFLDGISSAVKDFNGVVVHTINQIEVEAFPQDLPERFTIDLSTLSSIGDAIFVRDLVLPEGVIIHTNPDEVIVNVTGVVQEAEEVEELAGPAEPEVIEKGKKEEEEEE